MTHYKAHFVEANSTIAIPVIRLVPFFMQITYVHAKSGYRLTVLQGFKN